MSTRGGLTDAGKASGVKLAVRSQQRRAASPFREGHSSGRTVKGRTVVSLEYEMEGERHEESRIPWRHGLPTGE